MGILHLPKCALASSDHIAVELEMTEEDARLALLQTELNAIQNAITGLDVIIFQIKGWCVTVR